jgi:hypothetical protein
MIQGGDGGVQYKNVLLWSVNLILRSTNYVVTRSRAITMKN